MKLNFCPECAQPLKKLSDSHYICINKHDYWNNPRACADIVLINDERQILVSKRAREPNKGGYDLPGGFLEYGENPLQAAVRELYEETSIEVNPDDLVPIFSCGALYFENETVATTIFLAKRWQGTITANDDSEAMEWKDLDFIDSPEFSSGYTGLREVLESKLEL